MLDSHPIHQYYNNPSFCNVLQIMNENQAKEELKDKKAESTAEENGSPRRSFSSPRRRAITS